MMLSAVRGAVLGARADAVASPVVGTVTEFADSNISTGAEEYTFSHTHAGGSNPAVVLCVAVKGSVNGDSFTLDKVAYNNVAMVELGRSFDDLFIAKPNVLIFLLQDPDTGANDIEFDITPAAGDIVCVGMVAFDLTNCAGAGSGIDSDDSTPALSSQAINIVTAFANSLVVGVTGVRDGNNEDTITTPSGYTEHADLGTGISTETDISMAVHSITKAVAGPQSYATSWSVADAFGSLGVEIRGFGSGGGGGGGGGGGDLEFDTGTRRLHVSPTLADPLDGDTPDQKFTTIQAALNAAQSGDVITIASGVYNERPTLSNFSGAANFGLWLSAEERGQVIVQDVILSAFNGTASWTNEGSGVYSIAASDDPYMCSHDGDFIPKWKTEAHLRAGSLVFDAVSRNKPPEGFAFEGGRLYVRLPGNVNPNGQSIIFTATSGRVTFDLNNADNVIIDGIHFRGAGTSDSINFDQNCANPEVRNCIFSHCRFGVRCTDDTIIADCEYFYEGWDNWCFALRAANGGGVSNIHYFEWVKDYHASGGNAIYEGAINAGRDSGSGGTPENCLLTRNKIGPCWDGMRIGELNNSVAELNFFYRCLDDAPEMGSFRTTDTQVNLEFRLNLIVDCFVPFSLQSISPNTGPWSIYRNVCINESDTLVQPYAFLKTLVTPDPLFDVYNNTMILRGNGNISGFGSGKQVWVDFTSSEGDCVINLFNNIFIFRDDLSQSTNPAVPNPDNIQNNILAAPVDSSLVRGTGGVYAGAGESAAGVNLTDFTLESDSPARGAGVTRTSLGVPDVVSTSNLDCGAHIFGSTPSGPDEGEPWPRSRSRKFRTSTPTRWSPP